VFPLTVRDNPNCVQSFPNFAKPPGRYLQAGELSECQSNPLVDNVVLINKKEYYDSTLCQYRFS
jgi:hypothetical protein